MKLTDWAREEGVSYRTALRWFHAGTLPCPAYQHPETGTIIVSSGPSTTQAERIVGYARVSPAGQKDDLGRQVARLAMSGSGISEFVTEVGSALNGRRPKLLKILRDPSVSTIVVEHRDRLTRFGFEQLEAALESRGAKIVVLDDGELEDDLVRDVTEVLTSMCARVYGRRGAANRARAALKAARDVADE